MASELLHCCICPRLPDFSDSSHLLTHVSSKGHLAHLHKLQVRSHQEESAGQQLAFYNKWFTEHNVAHLLSERMQQKEKKQAKRKADNKRRCAPTRRKPRSHLDPVLLQDHSESAIRSDLYVPCGSRRQTLRSSMNRASTAKSYYSPATSDDPYLTPESLGTPSWLREDDNMQSLVARTTPTDISATSEMAKLKGTIWPGMHIFDAADEETQRKRNQRKDMSVLARMQAMSELVVPMETVCSPGGTIKKRRHLDDIEDDSPVEGESPLMKQMSRRRRRPLNNASGDLPRPVVRRPRSSRTNPTSISTPIRYPAFACRQLRDRDHYSASVQNVDSSSVALEYFPSQTRKDYGFTINGDHISDGNNEYVGKKFSNPFLDKNSQYGQDEVSTHQLQTWLQPLSTNHQAFNPLRDYGSSHLDNTSQANDVYVKEDANLFTWQPSPSTISKSPQPLLSGSFSSIEDDLGALAELYAFTRNPLISAVSDQVPLQDGQETDLINVYGYAERKPYSCE